MATTILIADDHPLCAAALALAARQVASDADIAQAETIAGAERLARERCFDLILLDLMLPDVLGLAGLVALRRLQPEAIIAIVSGSEEPSLVRRAARGGANGFVPKSAPMSKMIETIATLLAGGQSFPGAMPAVAEPLPMSTPGAVSELSPAQHRVLRAAADGRRTRQIASDLGVAETTVKTHLAQIFKKLAVANRTQAILALQSLDVAR